MPKPEGWVPPVPEQDETPAVSQPVLADDTDVTDNSDINNVSDTPDTYSFEDFTPAEKTISQCAHIISWLLVPLLMPVYGIILIFNLSILSLSPTATKFVFTLIVFGINFIFPMLMVLLLKKMRLIDDVGLNGRKERLIPYIISTVCLGGTAWLLWDKGVPMWVAIFYAGGALAALINMIVNFKWKISAHAAGIAGIVAMLIQITKEGFPVPGMTLWIAGSILLAGILGSARVWLGRHTLMQVLAGSAVGFISVWGLSLLF